MGQRSVDSQGIFWNSLEQFLRTADVPEAQVTEILSEIAEMRDGFVYSFALFADMKIAIPAVKVLIRRAESSLNGTHLSMLVRRDLDDPDRSDLPTPNSTVIEMAQACLGGPTKWEIGTKETGM
jgi:hypothetical protein